MTQPSEQPRLLTPVQEARFRVMERMRHLRWCEWPKHRDCNCKAGRLMLALIEAEAAAPDPVASPPTTTIREGGDWTPEEGMGPVPIDQAGYEPAAERWLRDNDLYAVTHLHPAPADCGECNAAEYARLTGSPDPAALADRLVEEGRVSVWGRPGTKFTAKRAKAPDPEATDG